MVINDVAASVTILCLMISPRNNKSVDVVDLANFKVGISVRLPAIFSPHPPPFFFVFCFFFGRHLFSRSLDAPLDLIHSF